MSDTRDDTKKKPEAAASDSVHLPPERLVMVFVNQQAQDEFNREYPAFIERIPSLWDAINATMELVGVRDMDRADIAVFSLARMALEDFRQILILCSNGEITGGMKVLRGMFERTVTAGYLCKYPEEADALINFFPITRYKEAVVARKFISDEEFNRIKAERDAALPRYEIEDCGICKSKRTNHTWTKVDVPAMAQKAGLTLPLFGGYYLPMQETHATPASIMRRVKFDEESQRYGYDETPDLNEARFVLSTAHYLVLAAIETMKDRFKLDAIQARYTQCLLDFAQVWPQSAQEPKEPIPTPSKEE